MTRFKKELIKRGYILQENEICLPSKNGLESSSVDSENAILYIDYCFIGYKISFDRAMSEEIEVD